MAPLVLSLFPGIGLLDLAFEMEFPEACIVRGPDLIFNSLSDIRRFHPPPGKFDGVIGGPPCQAFSVMQRAIPQRPAENLIPEFERCVDEARPAWFVMENVTGAPLPAIEGYRTLCVPCHRRETAALAARRAAARRATVQPCLFGAAP